MKQAIGPAVLRGALASVAGVAAMDLYFMILAKMRSNHESRSRDEGEQSARGQEPERERQGRGDQPGRASEPWRADEPQQEAWRGAETHVEGRASWQGGETGGERHGTEPPKGDGSGAPAREGNGHGQGTARRIWRSVTKNRVLDDISVIDPPPRKEGEPATETVGRLAYQAIRRREPPHETSVQLGKVVHWTYGIAMGGVYGLLDPVVKDREIAAGLGYGAVLWLVGDELLVPMLGLSEGPTAHPPRVHVHAFGAHLVYGLVTATTDKALRAVM